MTRIRMVFTVTPHDPAPCGRCGTVVKPHEHSCPVCWPKES